MFAVIKTGGKQYRVAPDDLIEIDKIAGEAGEAVAFADVLVVGGDETLLGTPTVAGASVRGEVVEQGRQPKVIAFKKRRRKNSRRKRGHRQEFTRVRITEISAEGYTAQPPAAKAEAKADIAAEQPAARPSGETATAGEKAGPAASSAEKQTSAAAAPDANATGEDNSR